MSDLEKIRRNPGADGPTPGHWPKGVRCISIDGLSLVGVDSDGKIYFDGKPIAYESKLATPERVMAWIVAVSTFLAAIGTLLQAYFSWK